MAIRDFPHQCQEKFCFLQSRNNIQLKFQNILTNLASLAATAICCNPLQKTEN